MITHYKFAIHRLKILALERLKHPSWVWSKAFWLQSIESLTQWGLWIRPWKVCSFLPTVAFYRPPCPKSPSSLVFVVPSLHPSRCFPGNRAGSCFTRSQSQALMVLLWLIPLGVAPLNNQKQWAGEVPFLPLCSLLTTLPKAINNKTENYTQTNYEGRKGERTFQFHTHWLPDYLDESSWE